MDNIAFYRERGTKNCIAVYLENGQPMVGGSGCYECAAGVYYHENSACASDAVHPDILARDYEPVTEEQVRELHPALIEYVTPQPEVLRCEGESEGCDATFDNEDEKEEHEEDCPDAREARRIARCEAADVGRDDFDLDYERHALYDEREPFIPNDDHPAHRRAYGLEED